MTVNPLTHTFTLALLAVCAALPSMAATDTVTSLLDDGSAGTLRSVIANASAGDAIVIQVTGTIALTQGQLDINKSLTISGPGGASLAISGGNASIVFKVEAGITATISGVTIKNGGTFCGNGGGIYNSGTLTVSDSVFSGNGNPYQGGAIFNAGSLTVGNSVFSGNGVNGCNFYGAAVFNAGTLAMSNSTFANNITSQFGGAIWNQGNATIVNSTFSGNVAQSYGGGAAIFNYSGALSVTNTTFAGNVATGSYEFGGRTINNYGGSLTSKNSIFANGSSGGNCHGTVSSAGYNLSDDSFCSTSFTQPGDMNNTPAGLDTGGLKNNGGPTQTIAILPNSPAFNAIPLSPTNYCTDVAGRPVINDQRGISRPQVSACDIGSFEYSTDDDSAFAQLNSGNSFTGNQTVNGNIAANSFTGSGAGLSGVNATGLGGIAASMYARLDIGNSFVGNQIVNGAIAATAFAGDGSGVTNLKPSNLVPGTAGINISGSAATATNAGNALNLGGIIAANYARVDVGNSFNGNQIVSGNLKTTGTTTLGGGTAIVEHLSSTFDPNFPALKPTSCALQSFTLTGARDGDTLGLGVPNARMAAGVILNYFAWVSAADTVTIQACNIGATPQKTVGTGAIRVDLWKH